MITTSKRNSSRSDPARSPLEELSAGKRADAPGNGDAAEGAVSDAKAAGGGEPELSSAERRRIQKEKEAEERRLKRHRREASKKRYRSWRIP